MTLSTQGKPLLPSCGGLNVSVAHTGRVVAVAAATGVAVGVDVELPVATTVSPERIARRVLAPQEAQRLALLTGAAATRELVRYWTIKEAVGKALGIRLIPALAGVEVRPNRGSLQLARVDAGPPAAMWSMHQIELSGGGEWLAVALPQPALTVEAPRWFDLATLRAGHLPEREDDPLA